jgi:hypothetical protein
MEADIAEYYPPAVDCGKPVGAFGAGDGQSDRRSTAATRRNRSLAQFSFGINIAAINES